MSKSEHGFIQICSDTKKVLSFSAKLNTPGAAFVDDETFERWQRVEREFDATQDEMAELVRTHPDCEM